MGIKAFFKKAFADMKESTKAQHEVDKANFAAAKAEAKANFEESDLTTKKLARKYLKMLELAQSKNIEIKFATGYAYATQVTSNARFIILVTPYGIWLMKPKNIVYTKNMKIKASEQNYELATRLYELENYIGY